MKTGMTLLIFTLGALATSPCVAQDLEVLGLDDAIFPDELMLSLHGEPAKLHRFLSLRLIAGFDARYQFRNDFPGVDVTFARTALAYYASRLQVNVKATGFRATSGTASSDVKVSAQIAYYTMSRPNGANRLQLTWDTQNRADSGVTQQIGLDFDYTYRLAGRPWIGGFVLAWASSGKLYLGASYRVALVSLRGGARLTFGYSLGIDDLASFSTGSKNSLSVAKGELSLQIPITLLGANIHIAYAPAYRYRERRWNHELGTFFEAPLAARLF